MKKFTINVAIHTLILSAIIALFYFFVFSPQKERIDQFDVLVRNKVHEIEESLDVLGEITGENSELSSLRERVEKTGARYAPYDRIDEVALELANHAERMGFTPTRVVPPVEWNSEERIIRSSAGLVIVEVPVVIEMEGTYLAYGKFLEALADFPYHVTPVQVTMKSIVPGTGPILCSTEFYLYALRRPVPLEGEHDET